MGGVQSAREICPQEQEPPEVGGREQRIRLFGDSCLVDLRLGPRRQAKGLGQAGEIQSTRGVGSVFMSECIGLF